MADFQEMAVFKIAETRVNHVAMGAMLRHIGSIAGSDEPNEWFHKRDQTEYFPDDAAYIVEVAGRLCYKSFGLELNKNLTHIRTDHMAYIGNILSTKHGSVLEHASVTMAFLGVSRVFTHELVRHRAGSAFSQESMRFVRVDSIRFYYPRAFYEGLSKEDTRRVEYSVRSVLGKIEEEYRQLTNLLLANPDMPFAKKKKITSAMRRILPDGILTDIIITANHRAWRHMIEVRTAEGAEEEIREGFGIVAEIMLLDHRSIYQDMTKVKDAEGNLSVYQFANSKV